MNHNYEITSWCSIRNNNLFRNNKNEVFEENFTNFAAFIKSLYKKELINYPKFYKMDNLSKLGFLTGELLIKESSVLSNYTSEEIGIVLFNASSCLDTDLVYQDSIMDKSNYFPSPSVFVYTLPNIVIGEICIKNKIKGENAFLISKEFDAEQIYRYVFTLLEQGRTKACICGWVEYLEENSGSLMFLVEKKNGKPVDPSKPDDARIFDTLNIDKLYKQTGNY